MSVENLEEEIRKSLTRQKEVDDEQNKINAEIALLRFKLQDLKDESRQLRAKIPRLEKEKESAIRQERLAAERKEIEERLNVLRQRSAEIRKEAAWGDVIYDWQFEGAIRLASAERGLLADVRGMGKTLTALAWRRVVGSKKTLIATKASYAGEFIKEISKREPDITVMPLVSVTPSQRQTMGTILSQDFEDLIVITNMEGWRRKPAEVAKEYLDMGFDGIILDEAHHVKNSGTGTAQGFISIAHNVPKVLTMTGTPIRNRPQELFSILHALYPRIFPEEKKFLYDYCIQVSQNRWKFSKTGLSNLLDKIGGFYVARTPQDVGHKIPPPDFKRYELTFDGYEEQQEAYNFMAQRALLKLKSGKVLPIPNQLALMTRQAQITGWAGDLTLKDPIDENKVYKFDIYQSVKLDWAEDLIKELIEEDHRVVLFSRFKPPVFELKRRLLAADIPVATITGENSKDAQDIINDFDLKTAPANPKYKVLLATYQTIGESVNLNAARHGILFDRFWNPAGDDQASGRLDRLNSIDQATIHLAAVAKTIDIYMENLIAGKRNMIAEFKSAADLQQGLIDNLEESLK